MLLIDLGNSRLKWALVAGAEWLADTHVLDYRQEGLDAALQSVFSTLSRQDIWVSCVAGAELEKCLADWFIEQWQIKPVFVRTEKECLGVTNSYAQIDALGVDRWLAMVAAFNMYQQAVCVIDCGTAVTIDLLDSSGLHLGGLIMPGLQLMQRALCDEAALTCGQGAVVLLAKDTASAVGSGCSLMLTESVASLYARFQAEVSSELRCVVTGGDAGLLKDSFEQYEYREDLVLCGLYLIVRAQS